MKRDFEDEVTANCGESGETEAAGRTGVNNIVAILIIGILIPISVFASETCRRRFVNPITDICWSCLMPISIGRAVNIGSGSSPKMRDIKNPEFPVCTCVKANIPIPGITVGFWEPVRAFARNLGNDYLG